MEQSILSVIIMEHLSKVWMELVLAALAIIFYVVMSGKKANSRRASKCLNEDKQTEVSKDQELSQSALKALRQGHIMQAISMIRRMPETVAGCVPSEHAHRLLLVAAKLPKLGDFTAELKTLAKKVPASSLDAALADAVETRDVAACRQLHIISSVLGIQKSPAAFDMLAKAYVTDGTALRVLVDEAATPLSRAFAETVLSSCLKLKDLRLTEELYGKVTGADAAYLKSLAASNANTLPTSGDDRCGSPDSDRSIDMLVEKLGDGVLPSHKEAAMRANDIRSCGKNGDLKGAIKVFDRLGEEANNSLVLNSMLDACVECKDLDKAIEFFEKSRQADVADVITYNTMMKGYIANGQEATAQKLLLELSDKGLGATRTSYHGLLNARVNARDFTGAWKLVAEMQSQGVTPNAVTCSILLKGKMGSLSDVGRVLTLIDKMDQPMDEVLFLAVVESCIRTGRLDLLSRQTEKFLAQGAAANLTAPTFGAMIKAYGHARDVKRVWHLWEQMAVHHVLPTPVTLGCMVEALVANGRSEEAWQVAQKMWTDAATRPLVNTVIYSSILKGFAQTKDNDKVMAVYEEMKGHGIQANTITFNTILNAFAQGGAMYRVPALLEDMKAASPPVEPDIVTYSTIIKGFCNAGNLDRALKVLDDMKISGRHVPDEVMYNSLLSGCAKEHRPDDALQLLADMRKNNVAPSNYTLSMLVKLMGRCRRINQAFTMLDDISKEYGLKINIQVYTCLIQGCFNAGQAARALSLHWQIINEGLAPDAMTYTVLVRGCVQAGLHDKAVEMAKTAYGHGPTPCKGTPPRLNAGCFDELLAALGTSTREAKDLLAELGDIQPASSGKGGGKASGKGKSKSTGKSSWSKYEF